MAAGIHRIAHFGDTLHFAFLVVHLNIQLTLMYELD